VQRVLLLALAREPGRPLAGEYRRRHGLPGPSSVQRALDALAKDELIGRDASGEYRIAEPFLGEWLLRDQQ
jgi:DNA-binding IclR family transcriptional regulator